MTPSLVLRDESIRQRAVERIRALKLDTPEPWAVYICPHRQIRSLEANAAYWRVVGQICAATGHSKNVIHTYLRKAAWGVEIAEVGGEVLEVVKSSAKAERGEFSELIDHANELAIELGIEA